MGGFFGINAPGYQVIWFNEATKYLARIFSEIENNKEKYDLALPFYIKEVGQELVRIIISKTAETPSREQLLNPATFALLGMGDIIQNNTFAYSLIKQSGKHFDGNKGEVEGHVLNDIPRNLFDFARGLPNYDSTKKELETLKGIIAAHQNKQHIGPVYQMYLLCALIIWDASDNAKTHLDSLKLKNTEQRLQSVFRRIGKASLTLASINSVREDERLARSIVAHVLIRYTQEMLKYPPICERLGILDTPAFVQERKAPAPETPKVPVTENERRMEQEVTRFKEIYKELHAYDRAIPYYVGMVGLCITDEIIKNLRGFGEVTFNHLCDTAATAIKQMHFIALPEMAQCYESITGKFKDDWKAEIDRQINLENTHKKLMGLSLEKVDALNSNNMKELANLDTQIKNMDVTNSGKRPPSNMYSLCASVLHMEKNTTPQEKFARGIVAKILLEYSNEMIKPSFKVIYERLKSIQLT